MRAMAHQSRELSAFAPALVLLAICVLINYVDRGNLSIAAPLLKTGYPSMVDQFERRPFRVECVTTLDA